MARVYRVYSILKNYDFFVFSPRAHSHVDRLDKYIVVVLDKGTGGQLHSTRLQIGLAENSVLTVMQRRLNLRICAAPSAQQLYTRAK